MSVYHFHFSHLLYFLTHEIMFLFSPLDHNALVNIDLHISQSSDWPLSIWCGWLLHRPWNCSSHIPEDTTSSRFPFYLTDCCFTVLSAISSPFPSFWKSMGSGHNFITSYISTLEVILHILKYPQFYFKKITPFTSD